MREKQTFSSFNITLNEANYNITLIRQHIANLTIVLHSKKPADIKKIIDQILEKKIDLTPNSLEEDIQDIRELVQQAQKSSQTGNEVGKNRDATVKLDQAKSIENDLSTYVR